MANQFKTFVSGDVLTAAQVNSFLMKQAVIVCDSSSDYPTSPNEGMAVWDKAADALKIYTTATTGWQAPWNLPWGVVKTTAGGTSGYGYSRQTSTQSVSSSSNVDLTNATVTFTAYANRLYKISAMADMTHSAGSTVGSLIINLDGSVIGVDTIAVNTATAGGANDRFAQITQITTLTAGSRTIKAQASTPSGTLTIGGSSVVPTIFMVEDIGPVGAPA
jgi:hypothetical protein